MIQPVAEDQIVRLEGVTRTFGSGRAIVHALRGVDLEIAPGELLMLVGPSGCGKTTLLSILSGVLNPTAGAARAFGADWSTLSEDRKSIHRGKTIGFIFQEFHLVPTLNALENVQVPLLIHGVGVREAARRSADVLAKVGLGDRITAMPRELSGGMQQRVSIARALVSAPRMLVCDEPTANLDARTGRSVMELIRAACREPDEQGRPRRVVVVTHDNRIYHYADRIIEMEDGLLKPNPPEVTPEVIPDATAARDVRDAGESPR